MILDYTIPNLNVTTFVAEDGSVQSTCEPDLGSPLTDLAYVRVYFQPASGGGFVLLRDKYVVGQAGEPDTLQVPDGGSVYVTPVDDSGNEGCASNVVHDPLLTGVGDTAFPPHVVETRVFDVQGRLARVRAGGVYFVRQRWSNGWVTVRKLVIVK